MAIYSVEGKLGTGKTKFCVWRAQGALRSGLRVASNVDLNLEFLVPELAGASYIRIPDKPSADDLYAIGHGNPSTYDEDMNGILILDELGSWLNTRSFQDKSRAPVIDWLIHARKHGWHVFFICQDASMIDAQVRNALIEYTCRCRRLDKVKIPVLGMILGLFNSKWAYMPRMHMVAARIGEGTSVIVAERWNFKGDDLHAAYDTRQVFTAKDGACSSTVLHPNYFSRPPLPLTWWKSFLKSFSKPRPVRVCPSFSPAMALILKLPVEERIFHAKRLINNAKYK